MAIAPEIKVEIDKRLVFYEAPGPYELNQRVREFLDNNYGYGEEVTMDLIISYLRHNHTSWPRLQNRLQNWKVWSMQEHHEVRKYVDELIWRKFEMNIPWKVDQ